jgi:hypothetical protein
MNWASLCILFLIPTQKPPIQAWDLFATTRFEATYYKEIDEYLLAPVFSQNLKAQQGKRIRIKGYYLPYEIPGNKFFILSKVPYSQCFFCGGAGPESVAAIFLEKKQKFKADQVITIEGTLFLNATDIDQLNFLLKDAKVITE